MSYLTLTLHVLQFASLACILYIVYVACLSKSKVVVVPTQEVLDSGNVKLTVGLNNSFEKTRSISSAVVNLVYPRAISLVGRDSLEVFSTSEKLKFDGVDSECNYVTLKDVSVVSGTHCLLPFEFDFNSQPTNLTQVKFVIVSDDISGVSLSETVDLVL